MAEKTPMQKAADRINEASGAGGNGETEAQEESIGMKMAPEDFYKLQWLVAAKEKATYQRIAKDHELNELRMAAQRKIANAEGELLVARDEEKAADQRYQVAIRQFEQDMKEKLGDPEFKLMYWIVKDDMTMEPSPVHPINQAAGAAKEQETPPG